MKKFFHFVRSFFTICIKTSNNIKSRPTINRLRAKPSLPQELCRHFSLDEIKSATSNFDPDLIIGRGVTGTVYKGLIDEVLLVAVKVFKPDLPCRRGFEDFRNEVLLLCQLRHPHLVSLIGFCYEDVAMIVVYNYMSNGSLHDYLHGTDHDPLSWKQRLEICIGAARGLHYLHTGAKRAVIHWDIKSKNILLDEQRVPKISDFGMSKIGPFSLSNAPIRIELPYDDEISTTVVGTVGYLDPEFSLTTTQVVVTDKPDVYSFGVVLFEVLCGRKVIKWEEGQPHIIQWVTKCITNGIIYRAIDPYLKGKIAPSCLEKFLDIAFRCVQLKGSNRPAIGEVQETLELALELQSEADAEMECIDPYGEAMYEEVNFSPSAFDVATNIIFKSNGSFSSVDSFKTEDTVILSDIE